MQRQTTLPADPVRAYARAVLRTSKPIIAGPYVRAACRRHLADLKDGHKRGLTWDRAASERVIGFFRDVLRLKGGPFEGRPFELLPWQCFLVGSLFGWRRADGTRCFRRAYIETGKGPLALDTPIPTPSGWTTIGEIKAGDRVFDEKGDPCAVVETSPVFRGRPCFRVEFSDGCEIVADAEHQWRVTSLRNGGAFGPKPASEPRKGEPRTITTEEIERTHRLPPSTSRHPQPKWNHRVDIAETLDLPDEDLPIPPYTLGVWLGDGERGSGRVTLSARDAAEIIGHIESEGVSVGEGRPQRGAATRHVLGKTRNADSLHSRLRGIGVLDSKHIPESYLRASAAQRMALLQGLLDADGHVDRSGRIELTLGRDRLAMDAVALIRTLGWKATWSESDAKIAGRVVGRRWRIFFQAFRDRPPVRLERKVSRLRGRPQSRPLSEGRMIVGCDLVASVPVRCITVDSPSHMFLAGEGLIPTHNSGKSPIAAGIGLYMLCADGEASAEVYVGAYNQAQAQVLFRHAVAMVEQSPDLSDRLTMSGGMEKHNIAYPARGSFFRPISTERQGKGKSGPIPHCALLDELHEHPTGAMVEFLDAGTKFRSQPLTIMITNSGSDRESVCGDYHDYAVKVIEGSLEDDSFFSYVCALDEGDDAFNDEGCWIKANPSLPTVPGYDYIRGQVRAAKGIPSKQYLVRRLNMCEWSESAEGWLPRELWQPAQAGLKLSDYGGASCWGGLDLALSSDLMALVLAFERAPRAWDAFAFFWMPGDRLLELEERDGMAPRYQQWRDEAHLFAPPGKVIDYGHAAHLIAGACARFNVRAIAYDRAKVELLTAELDKIGAAVPLVEHGQGFYKAAQTGLWMPGSIEETEAALMEGRLRVAENPVLTWCVASATCIPSAINPTDRRFDKRKTTRRIDGAVALVMAIGAACAAPGPVESVYNTRGLLVV